MREILTFDHLVDAQDAHMFEKILRGLIESNTIEVQGDLSPGVQERLDRLGVNIKVRTLSVDKSTVARTTLIFVSNRTPFYTSNRPR